MKTFTSQNRRAANLALVTVAICLGVGAIQTQGQSVDFTFSDGTSDGWANAGFSDSPLATVSNIGGQNYIYAPYSGFQSANVASDSSGVLSGFNAAMYAALNNPDGYDISYTYYVNTATFSGATFLQLGTFLNTGGGYYAQDYSTPNELSFDGAQLSTGQVFTGTVTINVGSVFAPDSAAASEDYFRLGFIENTGSGTSGVGVYYSDISVTPVPEPAALSLCGVGLTVGAAFLRRRKA